jgi:F0F1-type ATP synthase alpha subunit
MEIKADEISKIIREQIEGYRAGVEVSEVGTIIKVGDGSPASTVWNAQWRRTSGISARR